MSTNTELLETAEQVIRELLHRHQIPLAARQHGDHAINHVRCALRVMAGETDVPSPEKMARLTCALQEGSACKAMGFPL